jgi:hypothetical protein
MNRVRLFVGIGAAAATLGGGVFALVTQAAGGTARTYTFLPPQVPPNVHLIQRPQDVERSVLDYLGPHSFLQSVAVVASRHDIARLVPERGFSGPDAEVATATWIVRANGMFQYETPPPGVEGPDAPHSGYVLVDDATGRFVGYGFHGNR